MNIYLTQKINEDMLWNIAVNDAGAEFDPLTLLRTRTLFGRPDWKSIYTRMRIAIESGAYLPGREASLRTKVGTFFCGPAGLAKAIKEPALDASSPTVEFSFFKVRLACLDAYRVGLTQHDHRSTSRRARCGPPVLSLFVL